MDHSKEFRHHAEHCLIFHPTEDNPEDEILFSAQTGEVDVLSCIIRRYGVKERSLFCPRSTIYTAAQQRHATVVEMLLPNFDGLSADALMTAVQYQQKSVVSILLQSLPIESGAYLELYCTAVKRSQCGIMRGIMEIFDKSRRRLKCEHVNRCLQQRINNRYRKKPVEKVRRAA